MPRTLLAQSGPSLVTNPEYVHFPPEQLGKVRPPVACTFADADWRLPPVLESVVPPGDVGDPQTAAEKAKRNGNDRRRLAPNLERIASSSSLYHLVATNQLETGLADRNRPIQAFFLDCTNCSAYALAFRTRIGVTTTWTPASRKRRRTSAERPGSLALKSLRYGRREFVLARRAGPAFDPATQPEN